MTRGERSPNGARTRTDGRHPPLNTRISSFAGRVTEAAALRKERSTAERAELGPSTRVCTCSDVMRVRCGDNWVSGRQQAGAHGGFTSRKRRCQTRILDSFAPDRRGLSIFSKRRVDVALLAAEEPATDRFRMHLRLR